MNANKVKKSTFAEAIVESCLAPGFGVFASPDRYKYQCWTRDLALAVAPWLLQTDRGNIVRTHLENLCKRQRENGQIPILFLSDVEAWLEKKQAERRETKSFMIERYNKGQIWNLTPGTKDSEILFAIAMHEYANATRDQSLFEQYPHAVSNAIAHVERSNLNEDGLAVGADWRDTMEKELADKPLLTNNVLLTYAYRLMENTQKKVTYKSRVIKYFVREGNIMDYLPDGHRPDPLGLSLAVLMDIFPQDMYPLVKDLIDAMLTRYGVTIKCIHNPYGKGEREVFDATEGEVVWPFVVGFTVMALYKMGYHNESRNLLKRMRNLDGFYEWYDPRDGKGYGAPEQLWSAVLYLRAKKYIGV